MERMMLVAGMILFASAAVTLAMAGIGPSWALLGSAVCMGLFAVVLTIDDAANKIVAALKERE